jgi:hypothetical protein
MRFGRFNPIRTQNRVTFYGQEVDMQETATINDEFDAGCPYCRDHPHLILEVPMKGDITLECQDCHRKWQGKTWAKLVEVRK